MIRLWDDGGIYTYMHIESDHVEGKSIIFINLSLRKFHLDDNLVPDCQEVSEFRVMCP